MKHAKNLKEFLVKYTVIATAFTWLVAGRVDKLVSSFGESFLEKPGGKIYLTLRTRTRIHGLTLIAGAKCSSDPY